MQLTRKLFAAGAPARGDVPGARQRPLVRPSTGGDSRIGRMVSGLFSEHLSYLSPLKYNFILLVIKVYQTF